MKRKGKILINIAATYCIFFMMMNYLTDLVERKSSYFKYEPFYEANGEYDVLFMGNSHVLNGIFPMELWNEYGIVSYNFGGHGNCLATTYWIMENALDNSAPELMVIDCSNLSFAGKVRPEQTGIDQQHISFDSVPLSINKLKALWDILEDYDHKLDFIWDFSLYHNRWNELERRDFEPSVTVEKGAESRIAVGSAPIEPEKISNTEMMEEYTVSVEYLIKIIEECQDRGIEVLLTYLPFPAEEQYQREANLVYAIAEEYDVHYVNFLDMDTVNYDTDYYESNQYMQHLNPSGARKVTSYLGNYIMENYDILDHRSDASYQDWYQDYEEYMEYKIGILKGQAVLENYLMLLHDKNFDCTIQIGNSEVLNKDKIAVLLENLNIDCNQVSTEGASEIMVEAGGESVDYGYGGEVVMLEGDVWPDIYITVREHTTGEVVDSVGFTYISDDTQQIDRIGVQ